MKIATTTSSHDVMNEKIAPVRTPGRMIGNVMCAKVRRGSAPRFAAASSRLRSIVRSDVATPTTTNGSASAVWATTSPTTDPAIRHCTNSPNIPIAITTTGTISGDSARRVDERSGPGTARASGRARRACPSTVASIAVSDGDLDAVDECRSTTAGRSTIRSYHWNVKPSGGKLRMRASVKLIGTITSVGASR